MIGDGIYWAASENVIIKVDVLNAKWKIGRRKDLSKFDKGQILKLQLFWECFLSALLSISQKFHAQL